MAECLSFGLWAQSSYRKGKANWCVGACVFKSVCLYLRVGPLPNSTLANGLAAVLAICCNDCVVGATVANSFAKYLMKERNSLWWRCNYLKAKTAMDSFFVAFSFLPLFASSKIIMNFLDAFAKIIYLDQKNHWENKRFLTSPKWLT